MAGAAKSAAERAIAAVASAQEFEPALDPGAAKYLTFCGLLNEYARIYELLHSGPDRDECSALKSAIKVLENLSELFGKVLTFDLHQTGNERLSKIEEFLTRKVGGASTSFGEGFDPPTEADPGAN